MELFELIYDSLTGELLDPIVGVPNAFAQGSYCENQYRLICEAYERLRERLGVGMKIRMWNRSSMGFSASNDIYARKCLRLETI